MTARGELGPATILDRQILTGDPPAVARTILGAVLVRDSIEGGLVAVRVVETEAYREDDPASHTFRGRTPRNAVMFGPAGHAYVYFTYGMHHCVNVVCGGQGEGAAVLLRAGIPLRGLAQMRSRRTGARRDRDLTNGPSKLAQALHITRELDGVDLLSPRSPLRLVTDGWTPDPAGVRAGPRVGVRLAADTPWRFHLDGVEQVSRYVRHRAALPPGSG